MDKDNFINDIDKLIEDIKTLMGLSRFYMYDSEEHFNEYLKSLKKMKHFLEMGRYDKVFKKGGEMIDDS